MSKKRNISIVPAQTRATARPLTVAMRAYYSSYHLWGARHFAEQVVDREAALLDAAPIFDIEHRALVNATITAAAGFLESVINELLQDASERYHTYLESLSKPALDQLAELGKAETAPPFRSTLRKYQDALKIIAGADAVLNPALRKRADLVLELRNTILHYRPSTRTAGDLDELALALQKEFPANPLIQGGAGNPYFPDHCLGGGCARWAYESGKAFVDAFVDRIGVLPNYRRVEFTPARCK